MSSNSNRHGEWPLEQKVYIGDLGSEATKYELEDAFTPFGAVKNVWIAKKPPGFAFVLMDDARDAADAVKELDGSRICGKRVKVEISKGGRNGGGGRDRDRDRRRDRSGDRRRSRSRDRSRDRDRKRSRSKSGGRRNRSTERRRRDRD